MVVVVTDYRHIHSLLAPLAVTVHPCLSGPFCHVRYDLPSILPCFYPTVGHSLTSFNSRQVGRRVFPNRHHITFGSDVNYAVYVLMYAPREPLIISDGDQRPVEIGVRESTVMAIEIREAAYGS